MIGSRAQVTDEFVLFYIAFAVIWFMLLTPLIAALQASSSSPESTIQGFNQTLLEAELNVTANVTQAVSAFDIMGSLGYLLLLLGSYLDLHLSTPLWILDLLIVGIGGLFGIYTLITSIHKISPL